MVVLYSKSVPSTCEQAVQARLVELSRKTGYNFVQNNGQRVYTPSPTWKLQTPPKGSEVFIGKLPRNMFEDELIPVFSKIGRLYNFRMMMDFSGKNRGFAFACYMNVVDASRAVRVLNNYEVRKNIRIGVYKSVDNCRLFVGNLPVNIDREELSRGLGEYVENIVEVIMYPDVHNERQNRGYAFVEFANHCSAAMARRQLAPASLELFGKQIHVDWADPIPEVDPDVMAQVTILYIRNLPLDIQKRQVHQVLERVIGKEIITRIHKNYNYAFIHFISRSAAEHAFHKLQGMKIEDRLIDVTWARPKDYSKTNRLITPPTNYCTSVPPKLRRAMTQMRYTNSLGSSEGTSSLDSSSGSPRPLAESTPRVYNNAVATYYMGSRYGLPDGNPGAQAMGMVHYPNPMMPQVPNNWYMAPGMAMSSDRSLGAESGVASMSSAHSQYEFNYVNGMTSRIPFQGMDPAALGQY